LQIADCELQIEEEPAAPAGTLCLIQSAIFDLQSAIGFFLSERNGSFAYLGVTRRQERGPWGAGMKETVACGWSECFWYDWKGERR
jgi:hypothetical protein